MKAEFWHQKWERNEIAFHLSEANPLLVAHFEKLNLPRGSRIFLPLCGKTRDIAWLLGNGYRVAGAELSEIAIIDLFKELGLAPTISKVGELIHYGSKNIDIFVGDIFALSTSHLGQIDAIYDRAALVALPADLRERYAAHLIEITAAAPQLLITYEYDQSQADGPPFSVNADEVKRLYDATYQLKAVVRENVVGGLKGKVSSSETVWLLQTIDSNN